MGIPAHGSVVDLERVHGGLRSFWIIVLKRKNRADEEVLSGHCGL